MSSTGIRTDIRTFHFPHGSVEGRLVLPVGASQLLVISNGHNGFYSYGMFPWLQDQLAEAGFASYSYNYSHGGTRGQEDAFSDLEAYARNCMRLEREDLVAVVRALGRDLPHLEICLMAHSMGAVPVIFGALVLREQAVDLGGVFLLAPVSRLDIWPAEMMEEWARTGTIYMPNRRTGQNLPMGPERLAEIRRADTDWNMEVAVRALRLPLTVIHGLEDEAVPCKHGQDLVRWAFSAGSRARFVGIAATGHTFGTRHPFEGPDKGTLTMQQALLTSLRQN
jgi:uncharacterized protein